MRRFRNHAGHPFVFKQGHARGDRPYLQVDVSSPVDAGRAIASDLLSHHPENQGDQKNDQKHKKQNLGDLRSASGDAAETKDRRDNRDEKEDCCPFQHDDLRLPLPGVALVWRGTGWPRPLDTRAAVDGPPAARAWTSL